MKKKLLALTLSLSALLITGCGPTGEGNNDNPNIDNPENPGEDNNDLVPNVPEATTDWDDFDKQLMKNNLGNFVAPFIPLNGIIADFDGFYKCVTISSTAVEGTEDNVNTYINSLKEVGFADKTETVEGMTDTYLYKEIDSQKGIRADVYLDEILGPGLGNYFECDLYYMSEDPNDKQNGWLAEDVLMMKDKLYGYVIPSMETIAEIDPTYFWMWVNQENYLTGSFLEDLSAKSQDIANLFIADGFVDVTEDAGLTGPNEFYLQKEVSKNNLVDVMIYTSEFGTDINVFPFTVYTEWPEAQLARDFKENGIYNFALPSFEGATEIQLYEESIATDGYYLVECYTDDVTLGTKYIEKLKKIDGYKYDEANSCFETKYGFTVTVLDDIEANRTFSIAVSETYIVPDDPEGKSVFDFTDSTQMTKADANESIWETQNSKMVVVKGDSPSDVGNGNSDFLQNPLRLYMNQVITISSKTEAQIKEINITVDSDKRDETKYLTNLKASTFVVRMFLAQLLFQTV